MDSTSNHNEGAESLATISTARIDEILNIEVNQIIRNKIRQLNKIIEIKNSGELKRLVYKNIVEFLNAHDFFKPDIKESMVNSFLQIVITTIINFIKREKGFKNLWIDNEFNFNHSYFELSNEEEEKLKGNSMEIIIFADRRQERVSPDHCKPIVIFENKRGGVDPIKGINQCILALNSMFNLIGGKEPVFGILFNGQSWYLIKFSSLKNIELSKAKEFVSSEMSEDEFLKESSELVDAIYTIITNYFESEE